MSICSICLEDDSYNELHVTNCNHIFHLTCILKINQEQHKNTLFNILNCPMCRNKISIPKIITNLPNIINAKKNKI